VGADGGHRELDAGDGVRGLRFQPPPRGRADGPDARHPLLLPGHDGGRGQRHVRLHHPRGGQRGGQLPIGRRQRQPARRLEPRSVRRDHRRRDHRLPGRRIQRGPAGGARRLVGRWRPDEQRLELQRVRGPLLHAGPGPAAARAVVHGARQPREQQRLLLRLLRPARQRQRRALVVQGPRQRADHRTGLEHRVPDGGAAAVARRHARGRVRGPVHRLRLRRAAPPAPERTLDRREHRVDGRRDHRVGGLHDRVRQAQHPLLRAHARLLAGPEPGPPAPDGERGHGGRRHRQLGRVRPAGLRRVLGVPGRVGVRAGRGRGGRQPVVPAAAGQPRQPVPGARQRGAGRPHRDAGPRVPRPAPGLEPGQRRRGRSLRRRAAGQQLLRAIGGRGPGGGAVAGVDGLPRLVGAGGGRLDAASQRVRRGGPAGGGRPVRRADRRAAGGHGLLLAGAAPGPGAGVERLVGAGRVRDDDADADGEPADQPGGRERRRRLDGHGGHAGVADLGHVPGRRALRGEQVLRNRGALRQRGGLRQRLPAGRREWLRGGDRRRPCDGGAERLGARLQRVGCAGVPGAGAGCRADGAGDLADADDDGHELDAPQRHARAARGHAVRGLRHGGHSEQRHRQRQLPRRPGAGAADRG